MARPVAKIAEPFLLRIESLLEEIATLSGKHGAKCKSIREDIGEIYDEAKAAGVPRKALKGLVKWRELEKQQAALGKDMDIDEGAALDLLVEQLGDLGLAAIEREKKAEQREVTKARKAAEKEAAKAKAAADKAKARKTNREEPRADEGDLMKVGRGGKGAAQEAHDQQVANVEQSADFGAESDLRLKEGATLN